MREIIQLIRDIASLRSTVLVQGESGTGKELIARAIHFSGDRANRPSLSPCCEAEEISRSPPASWESTARRRDWGRTKLSPATSTD